MCKAKLNIKNVIDPIVSLINLIRARALNHRKFRALLEDLETEYYDIIYYNSVYCAEPGQDIEASVGPQGRNSYVPGDEVFCL